MLVKKALAGRECGLRAGTGMHGDAEEPYGILPIHPIYLLLWVLNDHSSAHSAFSSQEGKGTSGRGPESIPSEPGKNVR